MIGVDPPTAAQTHPRLVEIYAIFFAAIEWGIHKTGRRAEWNYPEGDLCLTWRDKKVSKNSFLYLTL